MNHVLTTQGDAAWRHGPTEGLQRFRAALAHRFGGEPEHILVLAGAQQGLDLLARCLIDPGDAVVIDRPGYLGAIQTFRNAGARLVGWDVTRADTDELEELLLRYRPKLIYTNPTHQNPTGVDPADSHAARDAGAGRALPRADRRGRHLSRSRADRAAAAAVAVHARRGAHRRHPHQQLLEDAGARVCVSAGSARCGRSSISWR